MQPQQDPRRKIRVTGKESVVDVARAVFKDARLAALISDLNPALGSGAIAANTVVTCPSRAEAAAFAKKMGFSLGFDEKAENGTRQKRAWSKMQGPGQASHTGIDAGDAARKLLEQKLPAGEVAKRLVKLCTPEALERFLATASTDPALVTVQKTLRVHLDYPRAKARLSTAMALLDATLRPAGPAALLQGIAADAEGGARILAAVVCPAPVREVLVDRADDVMRLVTKARDLSRLERGARDATLVGDPEATTIAALCAALADKVEPVAGERLRLLGLDEAWAAFSAHLTKLKDMLKKHEELLPRAGADIIAVLANADDGSRLARPWPLVAAVVRGLKDTIENSTMAAFDDGLGGLLLHKPAPVVAVAAGASGIVARPMLSMEGGPVVSAASLAARAASGARTVDEATAIAERLASTVCALVELHRPVAGDVGSVATRRMRRKAHFEDVVVGRGAPQGEAIARVVDELFADARRVGFSGVDRVQRPQQVAARDVAKLATGTITINQKAVSEVARAIVVVAMAIDRDLGGLLLRTTGREAFRVAVDKHSGKVLSKAGLVFAEPKA
jgi:hypothetical protein